MCVMFVSVNLQKGAMLLGVRGWAPLSGSMASPGDRDALVERGYIPLDIDNVHILLQGQWLSVPSSFSLSPWFSFFLSPWSSFSLSLPPWFSVPLFSFLLYSPLTLCSFCCLNNKVDVVLESSSVDILYMRRKQSSYSCLNIWASVFSFLRQPNIHHNNKDFLTPRGNFTIVLTSLTPTCACSVLFWLKVVTLGCVVFTVEM